MKRIIRNLLAMALLLSVTASATVVVVTQTATNAAVLTTPYVLTSVTVANTSTNVLTIRAYDMATDATTYTNAAYTNWVSAVTNEVVTFINSVGTTNIFTNSVIKSFAVVYAAVTNTVNPVATVAVSPSTAETFTLNIPLARGLALSNDQSATMIITYRSP